MTVPPAVVTTTFAKPAVPAGVFPVIVVPLSARDADVRNLGPGARAEIVTADRENEGGDIDADLADLVVRPPCSERSSMDDPTLRS